MASGSEIFQRLRADCAKSGKLYEDPAFQAENKSIYFNKEDSTIVWLRPRDICPDPQFFVDGVSRSDLCQGKLGNCWFLAATALLSTKPKLFRHVVPLDQDFQTDYAGMFHFHFWQYGEWVEVIVDDRLPTRKKRLIFCHNRETKNEFWSALIEKAYAKLNGSYQALETGYSNDALVDFTGGIGEFMELKEAPDKEKLFKMMKRLFTKNSFLCASVEVQDGKFEDKLQNGLITGHAYSITNIVEGNIGGSNVQLLRLRNPWGHREWTGPWSDGSPEWQKVSEEEKKKLELKVEDDGEFWMSFTDWCSNFHTLQLCHFTPDTVEAGSGKHHWSMHGYNGAWVKGLTAGGSGAAPHEADHWCNPQFLVELKEPDDEHGKACLIVSLMQKHMRLKKSTLKSTDTELPIGFDIYKYTGHDPVDVTKCLHVDHNALHIAKKMYQYEYFRERTSRFSLDPGIYCIVPATFQINQEGEFMLRVATERPVHAGEIEEEVQVTSSPVLKDAKEAEFQRLFVECSGDDDVLDTKELKQLLNKGLKRDVDDEFSVATARALIQTAVGDKSSLLNLVQCHKIWCEVKLFQETFVNFDKDLSGKLDSTELEKAVASIGVKMAKKDLVNFVKKFCPKSDQLTMDEFTLVSAKAAFANNVFEKGQETISLTKGQLLDLMV